ncbi:MAG: hypothetical protein JKY60_14160 [Kordiimonadaceae bacterium]|nr:hypothetical protein [Kordiimonadaceae bacterium]
MTDQEFWEQAVLALLTGFDDTYEKPEKISGRIAEIAGSIVAERQKRLQAAKET